MLCSELSDFPYSNSEKNDWPCIYDKDDEIDKKLEKTSWPKISIITPSYNQGKFIEETIRSVLLQDYPNLEYIIIDGGSTDNSVEIIKKYEKWLSYWVSEPDNGQADAIYRGFEIASGDIIAYINSDDFYYPGAIKKVAERFASNPSFRWLTGRTVFVDEFDNPTKNQPRYLPINLFTMTYFGNFVMQPSTFWKRELFFSVGGFDKNLRFSFDYELFMKFLEIQKPCWLNDDIAAFRIHSMSKSSTIRDVDAMESGDIRKRYKAKNNYLTNTTGKFLGSIYGLLFNLRHR